MAHPGENLSPRMLRRSRFWYARIGPREKEDGREDKRDEPKNREALNEIVVVFDLGDAHEAPRFYS